jgi:hypothetical protein
MNVLGGGFFNGFICGIMNGEFISFSGGFMGGVLVG